MINEETIKNRLRELPCMKGIADADTVIELAAKRAADILRQLPCRPNSNTTHANGDCLITPAQQFFNAMCMMEHWQKLKAIPPLLRYIIKSCKGDSEVDNLNIPAKFLKYAAGPKNGDNAKQQNNSFGSFGPYFSVASTVKEYFIFGTLKTEPTERTETSSSPSFSLQSSANVKEEKVKEENVDLINLCSEEDDDMSDPSVEEKDVNKNVNKNGTKNRTKVRMGRVEQWQAKGRAATFLMFFEPILTDFFKPSSKLSHVKSSETLHQFQE